MSGKHGLDWRRVMATGGAHSALVRVGSGPDDVARHCVGLAYLAAPYDGQAGSRRNWRIERSTMMSVLASREVLRLTCLNVSAICPTVLRAEAMHAAATVDEVSLDPMDTGFWGKWSQPYLNASAIVAVPEITGWQRCPMVARDVAWALERNVPVHIYARVA